MSKNKMITLLLVAALMMTAPVWSCTNLIVTPGASRDGSVMVTYSADSHTLYGELYHIPGGEHLPGTLIPVIEWDTGKFLGRIPQVARTWSVVGNMNEHQLIIAETTFGGRPELADPKGGVDYGSLIYLALQRARTAREAITVMTDLVAEFGYASSGESFSIADTREAWILEMIGKGPDRKGAVWVARRIPDGYVCAHANQARIRRFPLNDSKNNLYSEDVITFAREKGYFSGKDEEFSFADAYAPLSFGALRACEARVWSFFNRVAASQKISIDFVKAVPGAEPMPLWVKPDRKLGNRDLMEAMRDHFEGTEFDMTQDVGAGPFKLPYRWRPMGFASNGEAYVHERAISTQQTGFTFVGQARGWLPDPIGGILWFGVDDASCSVYVPMYCGIREAPYNYRVGTGDFNTFTWDSAFWVFNFVSNYTYSRWSDMIVDVQLAQRTLEGAFAEKVAAADLAAKALYDQAPDLARDYLTRFSAQQAEWTVKTWRKLGESLLVKYLDGNVRDSQGHVTHPAYPQDWVDRIARERGEILKVRPLPGEPKETH